MKKFLIFYLICVNIFSLYPAQQTQQVDLTNESLEVLHEYSQGYKTQTFEDPQKKVKRTQKISINLSLRIDAIKELGKRKDSKSIVPLATAAIDGISARYSSTGKPGGSREELPMEALVNMRVEALKSLLNYKNVTMTEDQKKALKNSFKTILFEENDELARIFACRNIIQHKELFSDTEKDYFNRYFSNELDKLIKTNQFSLLILMFQVSEELNRKSGINFLNKALNSGLQGRIKNIALNARNKLISSAQ